VSIAIPEATYFRLVAVAHWLEPQARVLFYQAVADALRGCELGEGAVSRAINLAFKAHYRAPLEADERRAGRPLRKLSMRRAESA
jgi:hypothetical protein